MTSPDPERRPLLDWLRSHDVDPDQVSSYATYHDDTRHGQVQWTIVNPAGAVSSGLPLSITFVQRTAPPPYPPDEQSWPDPDANLPDLATWYRRQLDEDAHDAERLEAHDSDCPVVTAEGGCICGRPARLLADIEAKRAVLDLHAIVWRDIGWLDEDREEQGEELPVCELCVPRHSYFRTRQDVPEGACQTVRLLASAHATRPGYRPEWSPR